MTMMSRSDFMSKLDEYCNEFNNIMSMVRNNEEERTEEKKRQHYIAILVIMKKIMNMGCEDGLDRVMMDRFNDVYRTGERAYDELCMLLRGQFF